MDQDVAIKVMGWKRTWIRMEGGLEPVWSIPFEQLPPIEPGSVFVAGRERFEPSTSLEDAWLVVEHLRKQGWKFQLFEQTGTDDGTARGPWGAYFGCMEHDDRYGGHGGAPFAICEAALKAAASNP